jgi:hypothetical protein
VIPYSELDRQPDEPPKQRAVAHLLHQHRPAAYRENTRYSGARSSFSGAIDAPRCRHRSRCSHHVPRTARGALHQSAAEGHCLAEVNEWVVSKGTRNTELSEREYQTQTQV